MSLMNFNKSEPVQKREEVLSHEATVDIYRALEKVKPPRGQAFSVEAYFIANNVSNGIHGISINLGNYPDMEKAKSRCRHLVQSTGFSNIIARPVCSWNPITEEVKADQVDYYDPQTNRILSEAVEAEARLLKDAADNRERIDKEIEEELLTEKDSSHVNHYIHNMFSACQNYKLINYYKKKFQELEKNQEIRIDNIIKQYQQQPHMKEEWKDVLKGQLYSRGEEHIYKEIISVSNIVEETIFGTPEDCSVCIPTKKTLSDKCSFEQPKPQNNNGQEEIISATELSQRDIPAGVLATQTADENQVSTNRISLTIEESDTEENNISESGELTSTDNSYQENRVSSSENEFIQSAAMQQLVAPQPQACLRSELQALIEDNKQPIPHNISKPLENTGLQSINGILDPIAPGPIKNTSISEVPLNVEPLVLTTNNKSKKVTNTKKSAPAQIKKKVTPSVSQCGIITPSNQKEVDDDGFTVVSYKNYKKERKKKNNKK